MRIGPAFLVALATTSLVVAGSATAHAAADPGVVSANGSTTDPFDESNAIDPGEEALGQAGDISLPDDELVLPPRKSKDPIDRPNRAVVCDRNETWISSWQAVSSSNVITHASGYVVPAGGSGKYTRAAEFQLQLTASVSFTTELTIGTPIIKSGLEGKVGFTVAASGSTTSKNTTTVETTVTKPGTHIFFAGRRKAKGSFNAVKCNSDGTGTRSIIGKMESYAIPYEGAVWCGESPKAGSFKAVAKKYCDE
jgi:hypothetical protein